MIVNGIEREKNTETIVVLVKTADGCADRDNMTVFVNTDYKIYIPNIFCPNSDGINDVVMISTDESVREISSFSIFDRWGNLVLGAEHFHPNDSSVSWDGKMKGEAMNPGVLLLGWSLILLTETARLGMVILP